MNTLLNTLVGLSTVGLFASASAVSAATWTGAIDNNYLTAGNWDPSGVPATNSGATAHINSDSAVVYTPGGDLFIQNGGTLRISAGSWTQSGGNAWIQMGGGNLLVDGGVFNQGTAGNLVRNGASSVTISSGAANFNGEFANAGSLSISGGTVSIVNNFVATTGAVSITGGTINVGGELKAQGANFTISGGTLNAALISFDAVAASFNIAGGTINLSGNFTDGIFANSLDAYVNFTNASTGQLHLASVSITSAANLLASRVRLAGVADASAFEILSDGGAGSIIQLEAAAIPEPSSFAAIAGAAAMFGAGLRRRRRAS